MPQETATESPFGPLQRSMTKLMDQMQKGFCTFSPGQTWSPNVNLYEIDGGYLVCVDLAGVVKQQIDIVVVERLMTIKGARAVPACPSGNRRDNAACAKARVHLMEIDHGPFTRDVELPQDVVAEKIAATYRDGLLWIEIPKKV